MQTLADITDHALDILPLSVQLSEEHGDLWPTDCGLMPDLINALLDFAVFAQHRPSYTVRVLSHDAIPRAAPPQEKQQWAHRAPPLVARPTGSSEIVPVQATCHALGDDVID